MLKHLIIATRGSSLALWQAEFIKNCLLKIEPNLSISFNIIKTHGDKVLDRPLAQIGGKGLFVKEIEEAILDGRADLAVHSIKDVPMDLPAGLFLGCIPKRQACEDVFISCRFPTLMSLPQGATIGTSSLRRQAQILALRPDLSVEPLRGNVDTRMAKLKGGAYDAIILAQAGLTRLGLDAPFMQILNVDDFLPAVGQGSLGIECQEDNYDLLVLLASLEDRDSRLCVEAERSFLKGLDGGCQAPIAAHARLLDNDTLSLRGMVGETDGSKILLSENKGEAVDAHRIGSTLAEKMLKTGAKAILEKYYP